MIAVVALVALTSAACGTREADDEGAVAPQPGDAAQVSPDQGAPAATDAGTASADPGATQAPAGTGSAAPAAATGSAPAAATSPGKTQAGTRTPTAGAASPAAAATPSGSGGAAKPGPSSAATPTPGGGTAPAAPVPSGDTPIQLATVGTYSGPAASTLKPFIDGSQLWVKYINGKGGLNGHQVKYAIYDDGGDPARHRAQVQDAVENRKVAAFLQNTEALTGPASNDYIRTHRVPVIGVDGGWDFPYENPMYFLQQPSGASHYLTFVLSVGQQVKALGKNKVGILTCQEAQGCADTTAIWRDRAKGLGVDLVYSGRASIAQPDFTAECLAARNAGVKGLWVLLDANSFRRLQTACSRQGYRPIFGIVAQVAAQDLANDPNMEGVYASSAVFPFMASGTAATDEFQRALQQFGKGLALGGATAYGWVAGKLLERAGPAISEPPTSESILTGLWSIQNDTLGGLTLPLTFQREKPAAPRACWFNAEIAGGKWRTPDAGQMHCL